MRPVFCYLKSFLFLYALDLQLVEHVLAVLNPVNVTPHT